MSLLDELKRRNVLRVATAYVVTAWLVIQVVETIFPAFGFGDAAVRIVTIAFAIGLLPTLILAWAFEWTPDGLKKESEIDRTRSITRSTGKKLDRMIMVVLALALGYFAFDKFVLEPQREASQLAELETQKAEEVEKARQEGRTEALVESYGDRSIAVLPFVNMSSDAEQEYFSDGISEELLNLLASIPELRVISRSSAFSYKGKDIKLAQVAEELNVANILEGSVRKAGNQVRITAQLIDARSDTHLWSETYDRTLDDIFAIQDEIAATVVEQLKVTLLSPVPQVSDTDPEAYALFLQARYLRRQTSAESLEQAKDLYERALAIDPDYVDAWVGLAYNYANEADIGSLSEEEGYGLAVETAEKALAIDPEKGQAYTVTAWVAMSDGDLERAARHLEHALRLNPTDTDIIGTAAILLKVLGRLDESIALGEYCNARDPVSSIGFGNLANTYLYAGRWEEALASFQTVLRLSPDSFGVHYQTGLALLFKGETESALAEIAQEQDEGYRVKGLALTSHDLGRHEDYQAKLQELIDRWGEEWPSEVAHVYAYTGNADAAFEWLEKALVKDGERSGLSQYLLPFYAPIQNDPRWALFRQRTGSSPEQLAAIEFKVSLPR